MSPSIRTVRPWHRWLVDREIGKSVANGSERERPLDVKFSAYSVVNS